MDTVGTVGINMKTAKRVRGVLYKCISDGMLTAMIAATRTRIAKTNARNIWMDYTWVRNNALCQSPENLK